MVVRASHAIGQVPTWSGQPPQIHVPALNIFPNPGPAALAIVFFSACTMRRSGSCFTGAGSACRYFRVKYAIQASVPSGTSR